MSLHKSNRGFLALKMNHLVLEHTQTQLQSNPQSKSCQKFLKIYHLAKSVIAVTVKMSRCRH